MKRGENMQLSLTAKLKLLNLTAKQKQLFDKLMNQYSKACNYTSDWIFNHDFNLSKYDVQKEIYYDLRQKFNLKSQLAINVIRTVIARYKTVKTQLESKPYYYKIRDADKDKNIQAKYLKVERDLRWLQNPLKFKRPQAELQRDRDWSFLNDGEALSINTLAKRQRVAYTNKGFEKYFNNQIWNFGSLKLIKKRNKYYAYLSVTKEISNFDKEQAKHVVGLDRGLRFLYTAYDEKGKVSFYSGNHVNHIRRKYTNLRAKLQRKGTKSAKRALKRISGRENRFMADVNHQLSKALVNKYDKDTLFVIEDLIGIRKATEKRKDKKNKYESVSWAFYQLEQDLTYKAHLNGSEVVKVAAQYTSQRCPKCGRIRKENRDHNLHLYICDKCGYKANDDMIASMNIQRLGTEYRAGVIRPAFTKVKES